jgi:hypothetical protein
LLVSTASPYPIITDGCERLVSDYQAHFIGFKDRELTRQLAGLRSPFCLTSEDLVLAVGRIHPDKNLLELVSRFRGLISRCIDERI